MGSNRNIKPIHTSANKRLATGCGAISGATRQTAPRKTIARRTAGGNLMGARGGNQPKDSIRSAVSKMPGKMVANDQP